MLIYFLSPIAFKTYQSQYRSKYSIRVTQRFIESKNFEFSAISNIHYLNFFAGPVGVRDRRCPLYIKNVVCDKISVMLLIEVCNMRSFRNKT